MSKAQFETNEAHYKVVEEAIQIPQNRYEADAYDLSDLIASGEISNSKVPKLDIQENWLNHHFPVTINSIDVEMSLQDRFVNLLRAQLYCHQEYGAKTLQHFMVNSDFNVSEYEIETLDLFKARLAEPLVLIDFITHAINNKVVDDEAVLLDLMLLRWFLWKLLKK